MPANCKAREQDEAEPAATARAVKAKGVAEDQGRVGRTTTRLRPISDLR
jgi:hypothetical protein